MANEFNNWDDLLRAAEVAAAEILVQDVKPEAEQILSEHIESDIYAAYTPKPNGWVISSGNGKWRRATYQRRYSLRNIMSILDDKTTLLVTSNAKASPSVGRGSKFQHRQIGAFLQLLESDNLGLWRHGFPRPAISNTQREFNTGVRIPNAIQNGITRIIEN